VNDVESAAEECWFAEDNIFCFKFIGIKNPPVPLEPYQPHHPGLVIEISGETLCGSATLGRESAYLSLKLHILHVGVKLTDTVEACLVDILIRKIVYKVPESMDISLCCEQLSPLRPYARKIFYLSIKQFRHQGMQKRYSPKILKFGLLSNVLSEEMNLYPAAAYLRHLLTARSTAGHGVHSPYVFDFLTTVVRNKTDDKIARSVESLRREMLTDRRRIRVTDLGAGSMTKTGEERCVAEIARTTALPKREAGLLARMVQGTGYRAQGKQLRAQGAGHRENEIILELGTSLGISTLAMALAAPERRVVTVEGCPALAEIARENLKRHGASNAVVLNMEFSAALESLKEEGLNVCCAFIDGNHRGTALTEYVRKIACMGEDMIIAADDIHLTKEMHLAWKSLTSSGLSQATMETLRLGIIFRIHSITPGRYRIRY
jgi:predicted O-methyltransferase YrrM